MRRIDSIEIDTQGPRPWATRRGEVQDVMYKMYMMHIMSTMSMHRVSCIPQEA